VFAVKPAEMGNHHTTRVCCESIGSVYTFKERIGHGTFTEVKRATHKVKGDDYAIKVIEKRNLNNDELSTLHEEISLMKKISHSHIVNIKDIYETSTNLYVVMELLSGGSLLETIVTRASFSEKQVASVMKQLVSVFVYLDRLGIVHRDVKPDILLYQRDPMTYPEATIKLTDMTMAKHMSRSENTDTMRTACGTPTYVAPEILNSTSYSKAVDMWSLGVILFILLCGRPPFAHKKPAGLCAQIRSGYYVFRSPYWDTISGPAKNLVGQLLTVAPSKRIGPIAVLSHEWFRKSELSQRRPFGKIYIAKIKAFKATKKPKQEEALVDPIRFMAMLRAMAAVAQAPTRSNIGDPIRLRLKIHGRIETARIHANDAWNVGGLKLEIAERRHCLPTSFNVSFRGIIMNNNHSLASFHGLKDGVTITVTKTCGKSYESIQLDYKAISSMNFI